MKRKVQSWGIGSRVFTIDDEATKGATVGKDIYNSDGTLFVPTGEAGTAGADGAPGSPGSNIASTIWRLILEIPANIVSLAALTGIGFSTRVSSGSAWATRVFEGTVGRITVERGDGVATTQIFDLMNPVDDFALMSGDDLILGALAYNPVIDLGPWPTVQNSIVSTDEYVIPYGEQLIVYGSMDIEGTIDAVGDLVIL